MSYIGNQPPDIGAYEVQSFDGGGTEFTLQRAATTPSVLLFIDGVRQTPTDAYSVSGTTLTTTGTTPSGTDNVTVMFMGDVVDIGTPSDDTVSTAKIQDDAITAAKIATDAVDSAEIAANAVGNSEMADDAVGVAELSATGTASATTYLRGDNAWSAIETGTSWQSVQTTAFTAVAGNGYPCNTTSSAFTVTLPATASVGDTIEFIDYAGTFDTNAITLDPQSLKIKGQAGDLKLLGEREGVRIVYIDATQGWVAATAANKAAPALSPLSYEIEYLVIAGGGSGGGLYRAGGGGAGGYRNSYASETSGRNSSTETPWTIDAGSVITVTVGAGGAIVNDANGNAGGTSSIAATGQTTVSSYGGGGGGKYQTNATAGTYGSGGGAGHEDGVVHNGSDGTAAQGFDGGDTGSDSDPQGGTGGGAGEAGEDGGRLAATAGGAGLSSSITGAAVTRGGGGGAGSYGCGGYSSGGAGGGGNGGSAQSGDPNSGVADGSGYYYPVSAVANTGGGGGGVAGANANTAYGNGGSGVVILRMASTDYTGTTSGSPTVTTDGDYKVLTFNASGSYTS